MYRSLIAALALALALGMPKPSLASTSITYHFSGNGASAYFESTSGCVDSSISIFAANYVSHGPSSGPSQGPIVEVDFYKYDFCANTQLESAYGFAPASSFQIDQSLTSASVAGTVSEYDYVTGNTFTATVSASWTGYGQLSHSVSNEHYSSKDGGYSFNNHFNGSDRSATVTATVSDGTTTYALQSPVFGDIFSAHGGSRQVTFP